MSELIDNRAKRIDTLKQIILRLHHGEDPSRVRQQLAEIVGRTDAGEIAAMEQQIIAEGVPVEQVRSMCDLHAAVVRDLVAGPPKIEIAPGHPVDTIRRENEAILATTATIRSILGELRALPADTEAGDALLRWQQATNELTDIDKHYRRKEDLFFSCLERHGITGPSKVMWAVQDEARRLLKELHAALAGGARTAGELAAIGDRIAEPLLQIVEGLVDKEERILLPMMLQTLTAEEWGEIWAQSPAYGWCLVEPRSGYAPPAPVQPSLTIDPPRDRAMMFPTGALDWRQLLGIFSTLPVDLTFVDADDRVRFFSEGPDRIFARSKAIIGRKVQHCHPPKSVHIVDQILGDFRAGRQNVAEFWINLREQFVHIRYLAVRDADGRYLGTLEMTQDLTRLRALEGERRLLQYESAPTA